MRTYPGLWVVLDGLDGSGKSTILENVALTLEELTIPVHRCAEPHHLRSQCLNEDLADDPYTRQLWFAMDARLNMVREVEPNLAAGHVVLQDRGAMSDYVYSDRSHPDLSRNLVHTVGHRSAVPDLTVWVDTPPETCLQRVSQRHQRAFTPSPVPQVGEAPERLSNWRTEADWFDAASLDLYVSRDSRYLEAFLGWTKAHGPHSIIRTVNETYDDVDLSTDYIVTEILYKLKAK